MFLDGPDNGRSGFREGRLGFWEGCLLDNAASRGNIRMSITVQVFFNRRLVDLT